MQQLNYDAGGGLVYTEVSSQVTSMIEDWPEKTRGSLTTLRKHRNQEGAASLQDTSMRTLLLNLHEMDENSFDHHTSNFCNKIWKEICRHELDSFRIWTIFTGACFKDKRETLPQHCRRLKEHQNFNRIIKHVTSPSVQWLTYLSLSDARLSLEDLLNISRITNLAALVIEEGFGSFTANAERGMSDRIVRAWSRHATESGSFSRLRFLMLRHYRELTTATLDYLAHLPALTLCCLRRTGYWSADIQKQFITNLVGWESLSTVRIWKLERYWSETSKTFDALNAFVDYANSHADHTMEHQPAPAQLPTLNFQYGPGLHEGQRGVSMDALWVRRTTGPPQVVTQQRQDDPADAGPAKKRKIRGGKLGSLDAALQEYRANT